MKRVVIRIKDKLDVNQSVKLEKDIKTKDKRIKSVLVNSKTSLISILYNKDLTIKQIEKYVEELNPSSLGVELVKVPKKKSILPLVIMGFILLIVLYFSLGVSIHLPFRNIVSHHFKLISLGIITLVFFFYSMDILLDGLKKNIHGRSTLNSLVSLCVFATTIYGFWNLYESYIGNSKYINTTYLTIILVLLYFMKIGQFIDRENQRHTELEISQLSKTKLNKVNLKKDDSFKEIVMDEVKVGDILLCMPGDKVLLDGTVIKGLSHFDESTITGFPKPVEKQVGSRLMAGSINYEGEVEYQVTHIMSDCVTSEIKRLIIEEKNNNWGISKRVDRLCNYLVPLTIMISVVSSLIIYLLTKDIYKASTNFVTILLVACPFGFALATPLSFHKNIKEAYRKKIFIKNMETLEQARKIDTVIFDKTGTLTNGHLCVSRINNHSDLTDKEILGILGSIEKHCNHAIGRGIAKYLRSEKISTSMDFITEDLPGFGVKAKDDNDIYYACNSELLDKLDIINSYKEEERKLKLDGCYVIYLVKNKKVIATIGLKDIIKKDVKKLIDSLKEKKIEVMLLTGDNKAIAEEIAKELDIKKVYAELNPIDKKELIRKLQLKGKRVMMVGDGINDSLAVASSSIGIALQNTDDIMAYASDVFISSSNPFKILDLFSISSNMLHLVKQNLTISLLISLIEVLIALNFIPKISMNFIILLCGMLISALLVILNVMRVKKQTIEKK